VRVFRPFLVVVGVCLAVPATTSCGGAPSSESQAGAPQAVPGTAASAPRPRTHLQIDGVTFRTADGRPFQWRGITAFRLLDYVADKNEAAAETFLSWAQSQKLTVVRVLAMGGGFMDLKAADGRSALSRLLSLAARHEMRVEVVGLAGTMEMPVNLDEQLSALGETLGEHPNALLEVANEPTHPTQAPAVGKPEVLLALAARVPADVPIALGSIEADDSFARGDYVTWHSPRDNRLDGWGHVVAVVQGAEFLRKWNRPVISDEPIGAGAKYEPGRRDDTPARFRAAALLTRLVGMGATFHFEGGLQARVPEGRELECFNAWNESWALLPADIETQGTFAVSGSQDTVVRDFNRKTAFGVYERIGGNRGWVVAVGPGEPGLTLAPGWKVEATNAFEGVRLLTVVR
jgi:hypothetical protein